MIFSNKNMTPFDGEITKELEEGLIIADGEKPKLITKNITANGTYNSSSDNADGYSKVVANVANSYSQADNGKVVSNQELVAQSAYPTEITENDTYDTTNYNSITVNVSGGGTGGSDVIFYDYDGTVVQSYSAADFANLSAMPANPTHTGLTAQGWNWTLSNAKTYVAANGKLNIGQMYITSDGKTRLYYVIPKDNLTLELQLNLNEDTELDIDWGDGSEHTSWTSSDGDSSKSHEYSDGGRYTVAITVISGGFSFNSSGDDDYSLKKVELGSSVTEIEENAFQNCFSLTSITIPSSVTSIGSWAFYECYALTSITIPNGVTSIRDYAFDSCYALTSITIPNLVGSIRKNAFAYCYALSSITIPNSITEIGDKAFFNCHALSSITIPNSITEIGDDAFSNCYALTSITIPSGVISIGEYAFQNCSALASITFEPTTPPTLGDDLELPTTCIIRVPQETLEDYTSENYYPSPEDYIYEEY